MKTLANVILLLATSTLLSSCGRNHTPLFVDKQPDGSYFITRELSGEEIEAKGYGSEATSTLGSPSPIPAEPAELLNSLAGIIHKVIKSGNTKNLSAVLIGHATPPNVEPFQLTQWKEHCKVYEKKLVSLLGAELVSAEYKISLQYEAKYKGKGAYLANVKFTPLKVSTDALWSLGAEATSEKPVNVGTQKDPVAKLAFSVTFTAKGVETRTTTDEFTLDGQKGVREASVRELGN